jgi:TIR domain
VFFDRDDLPPGGEYDIQIEKAVERSALFIFLITPSSVEKGRFTLTELEFARRKWREADRHVLPVLARATPKESIPKFLLSVTMLEPVGNTAAEVASAVGPLAQQLARGQMLFYGGLAIISGLLTWLLFLLLDDYLSDIGIHFDFPRFDEIYSRSATVSLLTQRLSLGEEISCLPFCVALIISFIYYFAFRWRQFVIIPFVFAGWFIAIQTVLSFGMNGNEVSGNPQCLDLNVMTENADSKDNALIRDCYEYLKSRIIQSANVDRDLFVWFIAGAVGAIATAIGALLATRRQLTIISIVIVVLVGALAALSWYGIMYWVSSLGSLSFLTFLVFLFVTWQPFVAAAIGRSLR